ncbi:MAG: DUF6768 family protein [Pseudomonadota bacterium]
MSKLDHEIAEALAAEDRALHAEFGELGLFGQLGSLFKGKLAWLSLFTIIIGTLATILGFYAAWKFATVDSIEGILHWGAIATAAFGTQMMIKLWSWMRMETNRTLREVKRLELQVARLQADKER